MIKKILDYIKNNKLYIIAMFLGSIALMIQMKFVVLYADDLTLGVISKQGGLKGAFEHLVQNYMNWGGGPTPFIAILFLMFPIEVWKIFSCVMIIITVILTVRMVTYNNNINKAIVAICMWILIYMLNIFISRETLYWLDGNLAYVLTAFQMIIYFYYLYSRVIMKTKSKKYDYVVLPIFAFFAGWSGPQAGAITVIVPIILFIWAIFINKEKIRPLYIISAIIGLIGFLIYFLAPGNSVRALEFPEYYSYNMIERILYRADAIWNLFFNFKWYQLASISFYLYLAIGFLSLIAIKIARKEENRKLSLTIKIISTCIIAFLVLNFAINLNCNIFSNFTETSLLNFRPLLENIKNGAFRITMLVPYVGTGLILLISIILAYYISYKEKNPLLFIIFTCSILGQMMMLMSPYSPLRSTFITVVLLWMSIAYLLSVIIKEKINIIGIVCLVIATIYDIKIVIAFLFLYFILKNTKEQKQENDNMKEIIIVGCLFLLISGNSYIQTLIGYYRNYGVYFENIDRIESFRENPTEDNILYLKELPYPACGSEYFVGIEWIETSVKEYFGLDADVDLEYEKVEIEE